MSVGTVVEYTYWLTQSVELFVKMESFLCFKKIKNYLNYLYGRYINSVDDPIIYIVVKLIDFMVNVSEKKIILP